MNIQELLKESSREYLQGIIEDLRKNEKPFGRLRTQEKQVMEAARKSRGVQEYNGAKWILSPWSGKCEDSRQITFRIHDAYELPEAEPEFFFGEFVFASGNALVSDHFCYCVPWAGGVCSIHMLPYVSPVDNWSFMGYTNEAVEQSQHHCTVQPVYHTDEGVKYKKFAMFRRMK